MAIFTNNRPKILSENEIKVREYDNYIVEHRDNVRIAWKKYCEEIADTLTISPDHINIINVNILEHDKSKYSPYEFEPYRQWFYPMKDEEKDKLAYDKAWLHHIANNPHHWQYWVNINDDGSIEAIEMDDVYLVELFCDWVAMSYKFHNNPNDYYGERKDKIILAPNTRNKLEALLEIVKDVDF